VIGGFALVLCLSSVNSFAPPRRVPTTNRWASSTAVTRLAPLGVLRDVEDFSESDFGWEEGPALTAQSLDIHDVLLQRSIQTLYRYLGDTRNEMKAEWLLRFQNHTHLGDGAKWHSVIGLRLHFTDYYRHLYLAPVSEFKVRYQVGRPEGWTQPESDDPAQEEGGAEVPVATAAESSTPPAAAPLPNQWGEFKAGYKVGRAKGWDLPVKIDDPEEQAKSPAPAPEVASAASEGDSSASSAPAGATGPHPDLMGWQAAAASRRRNPYLQEKSYRHYTETLDPKLIAASLMDVSKSLSREWREDLTILAEVDSAESRGKERQRERDHTKHCRENPDAEECCVAYENLQAPAFESVERGRSDSTPLRRLNFELLQRTATILAAKSLQTDLAFLAMSEQQSAAELLWFDKFMADWWTSLAEVTPVRRSDGSDVGLAPVSDALFSALEHRAPVVGDDFLVDPHDLAERLYAQRESACLLLIKQLDETDQILDNIARECSQRVKLEQLLFL